MGMTTPVLPPGIYPQIYRDAIHGPANLLTDQLDLYKSLGMPGVFFHMFPNEQNLVGRFKALAALASARGLLVCVAFGLDSAMDPTVKGNKVGSVAVLPECFAVALDAEGHWDRNAKDEAVAMCKEIRRMAPNALILDQPWPVPNYHSNFPWVEFSTYVDIHAPQWYCNDWKRQYGTTRYSKTFAWFTTAWSWLEQLLKTNNAPIRPMIKTIQGYGWDDIFGDLVNCLTSNETLVVWCDPFPTDSFIKGCKVKNALAQRGCTGPNAVLQFQQSTNGKLNADNICGPKTLLELGL